MTSIRIESFVEYLEYISENCLELNLFRGVHDCSYKLIPKIGRDDYLKKFSGSKEEILGNLQDLEEKTMRKFIDMSVPYFDMRGMRAWDQWTIGQHHGIPTRFLDWTQNPLIALYFAVESGHGADAAVYIIDRSEFGTSGDDEDLFSTSDEVILHSPSYINPRIIAQKGVFTVHKNPMRPIDEILKENGGQIIQLIISQNSMFEMRTMLDWCGINRSFVYPGLDGVASYLDLKAQI